MSEMKSKTYSDLSDFIQNWMIMSHIYQPIMLMEILHNGGTASVMEIAKALLSKDTSQIEYYEKITKNMVGKVLTNNKITQKIKERQMVSGFKIPDRIRD